MSSASSAFRSRGGGCATTSRRARASRAGSTRARRACGRTQCHKSDVASSTARPRPPLGQRPFADQGSRAAAHASRHDAEREQRKRLLELLRHALARGRGRRTLTCRRAACRCCCASRSQQAMRVGSSPSLSSAAPYSAAQQLSAAAAAIIAADEARTDARA
eukprot:scaffold2152_cov257-Prasinococcus_capsulatus_cf.AAC.3